MPAPISGFAYGIGFVMTTASLHAVGIAAGLLTGMLKEAYRVPILRTTGSAMALAGIVALAGAI
jgi:urease accessory protein